MITSLDQLDLNPLLSSSNSRREMKDKFELYQEAGVKEYWIIDPIHRTSLLYTLIGEKFISNTPPFTDDAVLTSSLFPNFQLPLHEVFPAEKKAE